MRRICFRPSFKHDLVTFYRYENFDTQYRMPDGFLPLKQFDRSAHIVGLTYYPYPDVALKFDYNFMRNASEVVRDTQSLELWRGMVVLTGWFLESSSCSFSSSAFRGTARRPRAKA